MSDNIIEFKTKQQVWILNFTAPSPLRMTKSADSGIALEIKRVDDLHGVGQAWVPAGNKWEAKAKLEKMIEVLEYRE